MATLLDSWAESNKSTSENIRGDTGYFAFGQSFTTPNDGTNYNIDSAKFYLSKNGSPTGSAYAKLYAHTGTYGTSSKPTGSALGVSDALDVSTISASPTFTLYTFNFSGANRYQMTANTYYCIEVFYSAGSGEANSVAVGEDSSQGHSGNYFAEAPEATWGPYSGYDTCFYVYGMVDSSGPANMKTWDGLAKASVKTMDGLAIASAKTWNGLA